MFFAAAAVWAALTIVIFVGMRNYPELPGQTVPKPWMISVFLIFLVASGVWAHLYFGFIHQRLRVVVAKGLGIRSRAGSVEDSSILVNSGPDDWEAVAGTPIHKIVLFAVLEWSVIILGIVIPVALLLTGGAFLTAYLSNQ